MAELNYEPVDMCIRDLASECVITDVTCVKFIEENFVAAGVGCVLNIFELNSRELVYKRNIFEGQKIHGLQASPSNIFAVYGGLHISILEGTENFRNFNNVAYFKVDDWIMCFHWINSHEFAIVSAHNVISLWRLNNKQPREICKVSCQEKCILYSAFLYGNSWQDLVLFSGTVFQEVLIWQPGTCSNKEDKPVLHRLKGHQGVIFSIFYNESKNLISTTSDDRSVRLWKVLWKENWSDANITLLHSMFGHKARVWKSLTFSDTVISIGEDSNICIWNTSGQLIKRWEAHQGGRLWSFDVCLRNQILVTGSSDGGLRVWPFEIWSLSNWFPKPLPMSPSLFQTCADDTTLHQSHNLKRISFMLDNTIACVTDSGFLLYCILSSNGIADWEVAYHKQNLHSYCLMSISPTRSAVALATLHGHILIFVQNSVNEKRGLKLLCDVSAIDGKIFSLHWLTENTLLICGSEGRVQMWSISYLPCTIEMLHEFLLPSSKERWLSAAILKDNHLICGDRCGSIHLFTLKNSNEKDPCCTLMRLHGHLGVTSLTEIQGQLFSTGRDGTIRQVKLHESSTNLTVISSEKLPMDWVASSVGFEDDLLIFGFLELCFVIWSQQEQRIILEIPCGGGHRSWDLLIDGHKLRFIFLRNSDINYASISLDKVFKSALRRGFHPKEIGCACLIQQMEGHTPLLVTGSEDTTIRLSFQHSQLSLPTILRNHISSVKALTYIQIGDKQHLLFSAGGRAQIKVWQINIEHFGNETSVPHVTVEEIDSLLLMSNNERLRRPWRTLKPTENPETRLMDLTVINPDGKNLFVVAASSDGFLRSFCFNIKRMKIFLFGEHKFHNHCILKVTHLKIKNQYIIVSMATDGLMAFWDFTYIIEQDFAEDYKIKTELMPFQTIQAHQSGINSCDWWCVKNDDYFLIVTGGDDTAVVFTLLQFGQKHIEVLKTIQCHSIHVSQVTGVKFICSKYLVSAGIDQRLTIWKWSCDILNKTIDIHLLQQYRSCIPDIKGLQINKDRRKPFTVYIFGKGLEVLNLEPLLSSGCNEFLLT